MEKLLKEIQKDNWVDRDTIFVNCIPLYSSILCQTLNHALAKNELFDQIILEMPYGNMSQVFDTDTLNYEPFDIYLKKWLHKYINRECKYLFVIFEVRDNKPLLHLNSYLRGILERSKYKFATLKSKGFSVDYESGENDFPWENKYI